MSIVHIFCVFIGLAVYSQYKDCDPLTSHMVTKHDQLFPYFVTDVGRRFPGVTGLFVAAICSAALRYIFCVLDQKLIKSSSMSSNLNALSGVIYKDLVCRFLKEQPSEKRGSDILKIIVLVVGLLCTCLVFLVERMGEVFNIILSVNGITQGPLFGVFSLGILFPKANHKGAFYGALGGFISVACIAIPARYYQMMGLIKYPTKPLSTTGCTLFNETLSALNTTL